MKSWNIFLTEKSKKETVSPEGEMYTMFFKKDGRYFAAKEEDRIMFAKIKTKDTKDITADRDEISFLAKDMKSGKLKKFNADDVKKIQVCDKKEAELTVNGLYKDDNESSTQGGKNMCKCKCGPCVKGKCEKCSCVGCRCEGCSCSK